MRPLRQLTSDSILLTGFILIAVSAGIFCYPIIDESATVRWFDFFAANYAITIAYFVVLMASGRLKRGRNGLQPLILFLVLSLISAYSLNRELPVFNESTAWFSVWLVVICINYIAFTFYDRMPRTMQHVMMFVLGAGLITFTYLAVYVIKLIPISVPGLLVVGISFHTFVPLLFGIYTIVLFARKAGMFPNLRLSFLSGAIAPVLVLTILTIQWNKTVSEIDASLAKPAAQDDWNLRWLHAAQLIEPNWMTSRIIKAGLVYSVYDPSSDGGFSLPQAAGFDEQSQHDPVVHIASFFCGESNLRNEERINILKSIFDGRHQAEARLWSGVNLFTEHIRTSVKIWPQFALSYTEKEITVRNKRRKETWFNEEEALYTFLLPEGSVVTALSLWVAGKEEKGILTTPEKATNAYNTIVGRERRDPSVVHWQEGNRVTVRVFPVMRGESRRFKIGITSPLTRQHDKMLYENIYFTGPGKQDAYEDVTVDFEKQPDNFVLPASFGLVSPRSFKTSGKFRERWNISMARESLSSESFNFNGRSYQVRELAKERAAAVFNQIYLDVNATWTKDEFNKAIETFSDRNIFVYRDGLVRVTNENANRLFKELRRNQFSLFPFHLIRDVPQSVVITKANSRSPNLSDLKGSTFSAELTEWMKNGQKLKVFNLGQELSPYLKSLKEFRVFSYDTGTMQELARFAAMGVFAGDPENDNTIVVENSGIVITATGEGSHTNAPDHLMRLFAYNQIMRQMGHRILTSTDIDSDVVQMAREAYVVSPVSSLIVLESQRDYDRFDINDRHHSLKNASFGSKGSVPEPHEWALIIVAIGTITFFKFRKIQLR